MKTLLKNIASAFLVTATVAGLCLTTTFAADGNKPDHDKMIGDHIMMKDGKMMVMKGTDKMEMKEDMTLSDGTKVMKDGTVMMKNGEKAMLKDDDLITMDGKMMKGGAKKHADAPAKSTETATPPAEGTTKDGTKGS